MAAAVERVGLEPLQVREQPRAQREREALADPGGGVLVAEGQQRAQQRETEHGRHVDGERAERLRDEHVVDDELEDPDLGGLDGGEQRRERDAREERLAVGARQRPEAPDHLAHRDGGRGRDDLVVVGRGGEGGGESVEEAAHGGETVTSRAVADGDGPARWRAVGSGVRAAAAVATAAPAPATPAAPRVGVGVELAELRRAAALIPLNERWAMVALLGRRWMVTIRIPVPGKPTVRPE